MKILVTGAAGFIGFSTSLELLKRGDNVVGVDNINDYYDINLKRARLSQLEKFDNFTFVQTDISNFECIEDVFSKHGPFQRALHLAASAGVRYSKKNPLKVVNNNIIGHTNILELCSRTDNFEHLVFASSSSVYPQDSQQPFSIESRVDRPVSVYASTKAANELISHAYCENFDLAQTALRFFTVYGPWGRPDMSYFLFTNAIVNSQPIGLFNFGDMRRDFTYIDDIVAGTVAALDNPPAQESMSMPYQKFNLGAGNSQPLGKLVQLLEEGLGMEAIKNYEQGPRGEMLDTLADIEPTRKRLGYSPSVSLEQGVPRFVDWYRQFYGLDKTVGSSIEMQVGGNA